MWKRMQDYSKISGSCSAGAAGMLYMDWTAKSLLVAALDSARMKTETTAISCTRIRQISLKSVD